MEALLRSVVDGSQTEAIAELQNHLTLLDEEIQIDCSTLTNHCVCAANFEYFRKPEHFLQCLRKRKCFHCQRYRYMQKYHETVTATTRLILVAAALGKFEILKFLHDNGCSLETKSGIFELRPLHLSIVHNHFNIFCYLLTQKVDVNAAILSHGTTFSPLMMAVIHRQDDMARYLLMTRDLDLAFRNSMCQSPVMFAVQNNNLELMNLLLSAEEQHASVRRRKGHHHHHHQQRHAARHPGALLEALKQDNAKVLKVLLDSGCSANYVFHGYHSRASAVVLAAVRNASRCLELLLQAGARTSGRVEGLTALDWARCLGWEACCEVLRNHGNACSRTSDDTAVGACERCTRTRTKCEMEDTADADVDDDDSKTASFTCNCARPDRNSSETDSCPRSEQMEVDSHPVVKDGGSNRSLSPLLAIWPLCQWIDVDATLRQLVKQGQCVDARDLLGRTCLHLAVEEQSVPGVRALLQLGADTEIRDCCLATPFWHAVFWNKESMVKELMFACVTMETEATEDAYKIGLPWRTFNHENHGNNVVNCMLRSPLYVATKKNLHAIVHLLLEAGYNTARDNVDQLIAMAKPETRDLLVDNQQNPKSLATLTRNSIRKVCGMKIHKLVEDIDLPFRVKDLLLLRDLMDLRIEPVFVHV